MDPLDGPAEGSASGPFATGQVVTVFRSRLRRDSLAEYSHVADEMEVAARAMPGFVDFKMFEADDGERVSLITFASPESHGAWRDDPRHRRAQHQGRAEFYSEYSIQLGECTHVSVWVRTLH